MIRSNFVAVDCAPCGECLGDVEVTSKGATVRREQATWGSSYTRNNNVQRTPAGPGATLARRRLPLFLPLYDFVVVVFLFACHLLLLLILLLQFPFAIPICCFCFSYSCCFFALFLPIADFQPASRLVPGDAYVKCTMEACLPHPAPC